jgi:hypothetical protein
MPLMSEIEPTNDAAALDASDSASLRLAGFLCAALGGLLAGVGSLQVWVTLGIEDSDNLDSPIRGVDVVDGRVTLACAVVLLAGVVASRAWRSASGRTIAAAAMLVAGLVCVAVPAGFLISYDGRFDPVTSGELAGSLAEDLGVSIEEATAQLEEAADALGAFTDLGVGVFVVLGGGLVGSLGGLLTLVWAVRARRGEPLDVAKEPPASLPTTPPV